MLTYKRKPKQDIEKVNNLDISRSHGRDIYRPAVHADFYMHNMLKMRYDQFSVGARRSLTAVSLRLAQDEARYFLEEKVSDVSSSSVYAQYLGAPTPQLGGVRYRFTTSTGLEADINIKGDPSEITRLQSSTDMSQTPHQARVPKCATATFNRKTCSTR